MIWLVSNVSWTYNIIDKTVCCNWIECRRALYCTQRRQYVRIYSKSFIHISRKSILSAVFKWRDKMSVSHHIPANQRSRISLLTKARHNRVSFIYGVWFGWFGCLAGPCQLCVQWCFICICITMGCYFTHVTCVRACVYLCHVKPNSGETIQKIPTTKQIWFLFTINRRKERGTNGQFLDCFARARPSSPLLCEIVCETQCRLR